MKFGIIGTNFISDRFLAALTATDAAAVAVYSRKKETGEAFAQKHGLSLVFTELEAFLSSDAFEAVYVASPNMCHKEQTLAALRHGKHVFCEKPIAPSLKDYEEMKREAENRRLVLCEAMRPIFDRAWRVIKDKLTALGPIRTAHLDYCQYSSRYDRFKAGEILNAFDPSLSNAALLDIGVYPIAVAAYLFGAPNSISSAVTRLSGNFEGGGNILLGYDGFSAVISYSKIADSVLPSAIIGENGGITVDRAANPREVFFCPRKGENSPITWESRPQEDNMSEEINAFCRMVQNGDIRNTDEISRITLSVMDEVRRQNGILFPSDNGKI